MRPLAFERNKEVRVELHAPVDQRIHLDHPTPDALWVELRVPSAVERIAEIDALAVAADLEHLRLTVQLAAFRMRGVAHDSAEPH